MRIVFKKAVFYIVISTFSLTGFAQQVKLNIPSSHAETIEEIAVTSDGKYTASVSSNKVLIWEVASQKKIHEINLRTGETGSSSAKYSLAISDDLEKLAVSSNAGIVCYNIKTGKEIFTEGSTAGGVSFNKDASKVYGVNYGTLTVFDANTGKVEKYIADAVDRSSSGCKFFALEKEKLLIISDYGWSIINVVTNEIVFKKIYSDPYYNRLTGYDFSRKDNTIIGFKEENIVVYDVQTGAEIKRKKLTNESVGICTTTEGTIILFSMDLKADKYKTELLKSDLSVIKTFTQPAGTVVESIAFAKHCLIIPGTSKVLYDDNKTLNTFDIKDGAFSKADDNRVTDLKDFYNYGNIGQRLLKDNTLEFSTEDNGIRILDLETLRADSYTPASASAYIVYSPDGKLAAGIDRKITLTNRLTGKIIKTIALPVTVDERAERFFFNSDGSKLIYGEWEKGLLNAISISTGIITKYLSVGSYFSQATTSFDGKYFACTTGDPVDYLKIYNLQTGKVVFTKKGCDPHKAESSCFNGLEFLNDSYYLFTSRSGNVINIYKADDPAFNSTFIQKDARGVSVLGSDIKNDIIAITENDYTLKLIDRSGKFIREFSPQNNSSFLKATFSKDAKLMFTPSSEKGVQVWNTETGELLGTYYFIDKSKNYIFVSPEGLFDGSIEGMKELYFVKNNKTIPLDRLYERFYTPDLLRRKLAGEKFTPPDLTNLNDAPTVSIGYATIQRNLTVEDGVPTYQNTSGAAEITVRATATEGKVEEIRLFHNNKVVNLATRGLFVTENDGSDSKKYSINLLPGINNFRAIALNTQRTESDADEIIVSYSPDNAKPVPNPVPTHNNIATISLVDKNATMYLMVVGINAYTDKINPLTYALPDATAFKEEIEKDAKTVLANVKTYFVADAKADKAGIINAFNEIKKLAQPEDVLVFYYAGHGYIEPASKEFYLVSSDVTDAGASLLKNGIPASELQQYAIDIKAQKQLFVLDACQSAGAFDAMLKHDGEQQKSLAVVARSTGTHWMAASGSLETAKEFGELGHGAFTYVLLQALKGQATENKMITINGLKNFLQVQVPELVKKYGGNNQYPASYGQGNDFPVEIVK